MQWLEKMPKLTATNYAEMVANPHADVAVFFYDPSKKHNEKMGGDYTHLQYRMSTIDTIQLFWVKLRLLHLARALIVALPLWALRGWCMLLQTEKSLYPDFKGWPQKSTIYEHSQVNRVVDACWPPLLPLAPLRSIASPQTAELYHDCALLAPLLPVAGRGRGGRSCGFTPRTTKPCRSTSRPDPGRTSGSTSTLCAR
jgi:hypothetical protein